MRPWPDTAAQPAAITLVASVSVFWLGEVTGAVAQVAVVDTVATPSL